MGFLDRLRGRAASPAEAPSTDIAVAQAPDIAEMTLKVGGGEMAKFAPYSYERAVRDGFAGNDLVYACIREIATSAAEARLVAYRTDTKGAQVEVEGRIGALLRDPNPWMTQFAFLETIHQHLNIAGNAYFYKVRSLRGVNAVAILRPDRVRLMDDGVSAEYMIDNDVYELPPEDFGHLKLPHPLDDHYGLSPLCRPGETYQSRLDPHRFPSGVFSKLRRPVWPAEDQTTHQQPGRGRRYPLELAGAVQGRQRMAPGCDPGRRRELPKDRRDAGRIGRPRRWRAA